MIDSFADSVDGLRRVYVTERSIRIQCLVGALALVLGLLTGPVGKDWLDLVQAVLLVLMAEMINSAIEAAVDVACPEFHSLARLAKHAAAGGVLLASGHSLVAAYVVFWPRWPDEFLRWGEHVAAAPWLLGLLLVVLALSLVGLAWPPKPRGQE